VGVDEPPPRRETPWDHEPRPRPVPEPPPGMSMRNKVIAGAFVAVLYAGGMGFSNGDWFPGIVGGVLAGIVLVMVLNRLEERRRRR